MEQRESSAAWAASVRRRASQDAAAASERTKNGRRSRGDAVSAGPSALDRESRPVQSSVQSREASRSLSRVPRRRKTPQFAGSEADLTPF